jgi:hypothetical protein
MQTFSGRYPANFSSAGLKPEPENEAGYPAGTGLYRISGRFLSLTNAKLVFISRLTWSTPKWLLIKKNNILILTSIAPNIFVSAAAYFGFPGQCRALLVAGLENLFA